MSCVSIARVKHHHECLLVEEGQPDLVRPCEEVCLPSVVDMTSCSLRFIDINIYIL